MNTITISGSTKIIVEFFGYAINSILFQRGVYSSDSFIPFQKYGLTLMVTKEDALKKYLGNVLSQVSGIFYIDIIFCYKICCLNEMVSDFSHYIYGSKVDLIFTVGY